ncbi:MAG TPA: T9SS type A sorting domain-containing protein [Candidatus Cloacimonetes bacterium]|nr:T9SS type A sorting domain-containing protein [Candidatus Cloacimonadota bacterium]
MSKKIIIFLFVIICANSWLQSTIIEIKQDGSGDFETIQTGIDTSANNDTILVFPGIYYENIDYLEKSITVASTYIISEEDSLISQTIIDGNQVTHCVEMRNCENSAVIGFTIRNGWAIVDYADDDVGGGVYVRNSNVQISRCIIKDNRAYRGGGLLVRDSEVFLSGNKILYNYATGGGGGIQTSNPTNGLIFDEECLNDIYCNYACQGSDLYLAGQDAVDIIVDTFTVAVPDNFYIVRVQQTPLSIQYGKIEPVNSDLYVSPEGEDTNSGLSAEEPLKTIAWAQTIIKSDSLNPHIIHLAEGIFSPSLNEQKFPMNVKNYVTIEGENKYTTILDAENQTPLIKHSATELNKNVTLKKFTFRNGKSFFFGASFFSLGSSYYKVFLEDIIVKDCDSNDIVSNEVFRSFDGSYTFKNVDILNTSSLRAMGIIPVFWENPSLHIDIYMENCRFVHNYPAGQPGEWGNGGAITISGHSSGEGEYNAVFNNVEIRDNYTNLVVGGYGSISGLWITDYFNATIINSSIGDNITHESSGGTVSISSNSNADFYNTILYNNWGRELSIGENCNVTMTNSLVQTGEGEIVLYDETSILEWLTPNLDTDPLWLNDGDYPFALNELSPCIDAGTPDTTGLSLPAYDLAGNPRIYGETIDIGAYEWHGMDVNEELIINNERIGLKNFPNPFGTKSNKAGTTISFSLKESGQAVVEIFNIKGQKVKTLMDAYTSPGKFNLNWSGKDETDQKVSSGTYFYRLTIDGEERAYEKMLLLR